MPKYLVIKMSEQYTELKAKFKALQKYCRELNEKSSKLEEEVSTLRVEAVQRREELEREEFKGQQLLKRIEALQAKQAEKEGSGAQKGGFWGMFKGGAQEEGQYERLEKMYQVAQEDLQVKIEEIELEHQKQAALKQRHESVMEEMEQLKLRQEAELAKLRNELTVKTGESESLTVSLEAERQRYNQLWAEIQNLRTLYQ